MNVTTLNGLMERASGFEANIKNIKDTDLCVDKMIL